MESQIELAKDENAAVARSQSTEIEKKAERDRQSLLLSRTYVLRQLESASNERYKESLRQALHDIDQKITELDSR